MASEKTEEAQGCVIIPFPRKLVQRRFEDDCRQFIDALHDFAAKVDAEQRDVWIAAQQLREVADSEPLNDPEDDCA